MFIPDSRCSGSLSRLFAVLVTLILAGACAEAPARSSTATESIPTAGPALATSTPIPGAPSPPDPNPGAPSPSSPTKSPSASAPGATALWIAAGTMHLAHNGPAVLPLSDGRVLAVGSSKWDNHIGTFADETSQTAELWDPAANAWRITAPLNAPRAEFAAVVLRDGRAMVIGGLNDKLAAYSSTYLFDPATELWTKTGLLNTARAGPSATVLNDGRVLVVGGRYRSGFGSTGDMTLATYTSGADADPGVTDRALATAECYDPQSGTWSPTGSLRYARNAPSAALLGDGRVLVWGGLSDPYGSDGLSPAEIYDPALGRFSTAPALPTPSAESLIAVGVAPTRADWTAVGSAGELYRLADGDALLVGMAWSSDTIRIEQLVRFDASRDRWSLIGAPYAERHDADTGSVNGHWGSQHPMGAIAPLPGGKLFVRGGGSSLKVDSFDPSRNTWSPLPSLPAALPSAVAVALKDGSILLIPSGGTYADTYRFLSGP